MNTEHFKVSAGLKTLIGSELITDKNVAVFELVKNAFDAEATEVHIRFENLKSSSARIVISDNGKGMTYVELKDKWLFVAYSSKRDTVESEDDDYRGKVKASRYYAGAKGVGRFSSDRLGRKLTLFTKSKISGSPVEKLTIDWSLFDLDQSTLFQKIPASHETLQKSEIPGSHGTRLEIDEVYAEEWNREELKKLKDQLSKLVRPDLNRSLNERRFRVWLEVPDEIAEDNKIRRAIPKSEDWKKYRETINGEIQNFIFDVLDIKTTKIHAQVTSDGKIKTALIDREQNIYEIVEQNPYLHLKNVEATLYYMGRAAKINFTNRMGIDVVNYGNIFLYKNGFRILPYGEPRDDSYGIDARGMQGFKRYLTTRTLIGQIEIHGRSSQFKETTSRDGGLVKTPAHRDLIHFLLDIIRRLERYVVDVANWGLDDEELKELDDDAHKKKLVELLANVSSDKSIVSLKYNSDIVDIIGSQEAGSAKKIIRNFKRIGAASNDKKLLKDATKLEKEFSHLQKDNNLQIKRADEAEQNLEYTINQNLFLKDSVSADTMQMQSLLHHTEKSTYWINKHLENLIRRIEKGESKEKLYEIISSISMENQKIFSFTKYHKSTQFNTFVDEIKQDIVSFVNEYINNVCKFYADYEKIKITIQTPPGLKFPITFSPIEIPIFIDNLLNNSMKAEAKRITFRWQEVSKKEISLYITDTGSGISRSIMDRVFDFRFSGTKGTGFGLYHVKKVLADIGARIEVNPHVKSGTEFIVTFQN